MCFLFLIFLTRLIDARFARAFLYSNSVSSQQLRE